MSKNVERAVSELHAAMSALPPHAVAPLPNNLGEIVAADPMHASACVLRAIAILAGERPA